MKPASSAGITRGNVTSSAVRHAGKTVHRIAVNVKSSAPNAPSTLLFYASSKLPDAYFKKLRALPVGYTKLPSKAGGAAMDYVRAGWFKPESMKEVPPDAPGVDNDLKDKLEDAVVKAMDQAGTTIYAFGEKWGPEKNKPDQYFRFVPGNGIHDIHMERVRARSLAERLSEPGEAIFEPAAHALRSRLNWLYRRVRRAQEEAEPTAGMPSSLHFPSARSTTANGSSPSGSISRWPRVHASRCTSSRAHLRNRSRRS